MKPKGCGPRNLGSPLKQTNQNLLTREQRQQRQEKIAEQRLTRRREEREKRISRAENKRIDSGNMRTSRKNHDGSYNKKMFPPVKDYSGKTVTPGYNPFKAEVYKKNAKRQ